MEMRIVNQTDGIGMNINTGGGTKDHSKLINRDLPDQHPISAITGLQEALNNSGKIEDVKVNNQSVVTDKIANINLKTINNESISGTGNIDIDVENVVKTTANQGLSNQQKINAKNNIEALGTENVKQSTGQSTTDVISQKGVSDALADKQDNKPDGTHLLVSTDTGKLDLVYIPSTVLGGITNGGTFNGSGVITASSYAPELDGEVIDEVAFGSYPSYYFICSAPYSFAGFDFAVGDWAISLGNGWAKLNATDAVTSVNGKMGQVVLNHTDVGAVKSAWGTDNKNKNLVTDAQGNVTTSDYALGQIIVDYYEELPTGVPETAKASVLKSSGEFAPYDYQTLYDAYNNETMLETFVIKETITRPDEDDSAINIYKEDGSYVDISYGNNAGTDDETFYVAYTDVVGNYEEYCYSFIQQPLAVDDTQTLQIGWNKIAYDSETASYIATQIQYSEIPQFTDVYISYVDENADSKFISDFGYLKYHLSGEYIYTEVQPSTNPKTYYWKYNPTNVQSDNNEDNPLSLAYIKNRASLNTTSTNALTPESEMIKGTINLHKISKTGTYNDLINPVGKVDTNGEIFNNYSGTYKNTASGRSSFATGELTTASGIASFSEGGNGTASGNYSHIEGWGGTASGNYSHKEGQNCNAYGHESHAENYYCTANGEGSHVEGNGSSTHGDFSHAENYSTTYGDYSHGEGYGTISGSSYQHVQGKWNVRDNNSTYADIIGGGTDNNNRSNIQTTDWSGNLWVKGGIRVGGTDWSSGTPIGGGGGSASLKKTLTNSSQNYSVSNNVVTVTDADVTTSTHIMLYPADATTETWLENNLSSCIITEASGSFSFSISSSLPATFSMYYIIMEVE